MFKKLCPDDIPIYCYYALDYKCWVKKDDINKTNDKFKEFLIQLDVFTFKYTGYYINHPNDISKYWYPSDHYDDNEEEGEPWTNCMCGQKIKVTFEIYLLNNPEIKLRVGSECIKKCERKDDENSDDDLVDDEINKPLTFKIKQIEKKRNKRLSYLKAKKEGKICKNCNEIVNGNVSCLTTHGLCQECYNDKFNRCKNCSKILLNPKIKSFTELKVCKDCYPNEKIKLNTDSIEFIGDFILFKSGKNENKKLR